MGFIKSALGMIGNAATGGLASGIGGLVGGLFGGGTSVKEQKKIMAEQAKYERENMKFQSELNEAMAQANQQRAYDYFNMTANYNSAKNQKARLEEAGLNPALMYGQAGSGGAGTGCWMRAERTQMLLMMVLRMEVATQPDGFPPIMSYMWLP